MENTILTRSKPKNKTTFKSTAWAFHPNQTQPSDLVKPTAKGSPKMDESVKDKSETESTCCSELNFREETIINNHLAFLKKFIELDEEPLIQEEKKLDEMATGDLIQSYAIQCTDGVRIIEKDSKSYTLSLPSISDLRRIKMGEYVKVFDDQIQFLWEGIVGFVEKDKLSIFSSDFNPKKKVESDLFIVPYPNRKMHKKFRKVLSNDIPLLLKNPEASNYKLVTTLLTENFEGIETNQNESEEHKISEELNEVQAHAVKAALNSEMFYFIQGPPGTGKSRVLREIMEQLLQTGKKVWFCSTTNESTDLMAKKFMDHKSAKCVRIGERYKVDKEILPIYCKHNSKSLKDANLVFSTVNGARLGDKFETIFQRRFDYVIIDEAAQSTEMATWLPILNGNKVILAGDFKQLSAITQNEVAKEHGYTASIMKRLFDKLPKSCKSTLEIQYRMNSVINEWPSKEFYDEKLKPAKKIENRTLAELRKKENKNSFDPVLLVLDTEKTQDVMEDFSKSYFNLGEVNQVSNTIEGLLRNYNLMPEDIGVISPYDAQVRKIKMRLEYVGVRGVTVSTVDSFQGKEKEVIIISLVRNNSKKRIGFVKDEERICVAFTRAKRALIVVCSMKMMSRSPLMERFFSTPSLVKMNSYV